MEFKQFKDAVAAQLQQMVDSHELLFLTDVEKDAIWDTYLAAFPEGTNEVYRERNAYDCQYCRQFLRPFGNVVAINENHELVSIWDVEVEGYYQEVANVLSAMVKDAPVRDVWVSKEKELGTSHNHEKKEGQPVKTWHHFSFTLPDSKVLRGAASEEAVMGTFRDVRNVFKRSLDEITPEALETVLELIAQGSIYRGEEFKNAIIAFQRYQRDYLALTGDAQDNYAWVTAHNAGAAAKIRNNAIGTLLVDISEGRELEVAVTAFEKIMAPANYKRPKAILTKRQIEEAEAKIAELGYENSLGRRFAVIEDITVNNVLFANRDAQAKMKPSVFDELKESVPVKPKNFDKVEEISISDFMSNVLPTAKKLEVMLENKHFNSLMSLIAPIDGDAPSMFKWGNNFSWAYNGDVTDTIREAVKAHGGKVDGVMRFSIGWDHNDDLDAHCIEPNGNEIYFREMRSRTGGNLDVDITVPENYRGKKAGVVENITWPSLSTMLEGRYKMVVHNFSRRTQGNTMPEGFRAEIEFGGEIHSFEYTQLVRNNQSVLVAEFDFSKKDGITFIKSLDPTTASKEVWGVKTNEFHNVPIVLNSPNHWDEKAVGNKHVFFILEGCKNDEQPRGFFNEFLNEELMKQKRVFEALGAKMRVEPSDRQLSGIGISSTLKDSVLVRVTGQTTRVLKINN